MPLEHLKHESNGRTFKVLDAELNPTGQLCYKSFIGQKNVDLGGDVFAPYVWDEPSKSIRYSNKVCEFYSGGYQTIREFGSVETLIDDQRFEVQYWDDPQWRVLDLWQVGLTVDQQDDYCIVTRNLSDGLGNTLDVDFLFRPHELVKNTFRLHVVDTNLIYRIRFQNSGIAGEVVEIPCINLKTQVNLGVYKLRFDVMGFQWNKDEIDLHSYTIESQAGGKKLDIFISDFVLDGNGDVVISPDQWGETGVSQENDDCCEGTDYGVALTGVDADGVLCGQVDWEGPQQDWDYAARFQNVTIAANPASVDIGTQIEFDCGYSEGSFTPICYGLEGDTPDFNAAAPSTRTRTAASISFTQPAEGNDRVVNGANFQALIKEILDTSWSSGYDLGITFDENDAVGPNDGFQVHDYGDGVAARITIVYTPAVSLDLEQEGFRWRDDDDSESAAAWLADQDVDITRAKETNTRLRILLNTTGDQAAKQFKLQYKKTSDAEWRDMPES